MRSPEKKSPVHSLTQHQRKDTMQSRGELTATSGAQLLTLSFEASAPLLSYFLSSASRGELGLLDSLQVLKAGHLRHQSLDLGPSLCLLVDQLRSQLLGGP
jgi:hypothetical protein